MISNQHAELVRSARNAISDEVIKAISLLPTHWPGKLLIPVVRLATTRFARMMANFDRDVQEFGTQHAARRLLPNLIQGCRQSGTEMVPQTGPVLVASNHPGAVDSMVILAALPRTDVKFIVSDVPFLHALPHIKQHCIYTAADVNGRFGTVRETIRHLETGGTVIMYPGTQLDPDPAIQSGACERLNDWSRSVSLLLRRTPETGLVVAIVSGVLEPRFLSHPLTRLAPAGWQRQKLVGMLQIMQQLLLGMRLDLCPRVTFEQPVTGAELQGTGPSRALHEAILEHARRGLAWHLSAGVRFLDLSDGQKTRPKSFA